MKNKILLLISFLVLPMCGVAAQGVCVIDEANLTEFKGIVKQRDNQVVPKASIQVYKRKGHKTVFKKPVRETQTDDKGYFEIKTLSSGRYFVAVNMQNYVELRFTFRISKEKDSSDHKMIVLLGWDVNDDCGGGGASIDPN